MSSFTLGACSGGGPGPAQPNIGQVAAALRLVEFDSCNEALQQLKQAAADYVSPYGLGGGAVRLEGDLAMSAEVGGAARAGDAAVAGEAMAGAAEAGGGVGAPPAYSTTNTHEAGVDEPDLVKTDGRRIVSLVDGTLRVVDAKSKELVGTLRFAEASDGWWYPHQLLLSGDRALILGQGSTEVASRGSVAGADIMFAPSGSTLILVDLSGAPTVVSELDVSGSFVDARQVDSVARVVLQSAPDLAWTYPSETGSEDDALQANRDMLTRSTIEDWLPQYIHREDGKRTEGQLVDCADVSHPRTYSGTSMLTVLTVDLAAGLRAGNSVAVVGDGQTVYGTGSSLYIADDHRGWPLPVDVPAAALPAANEATTEIHKFDVSGSGKPEYVASGEVGGWLLNQYALSEFDGHLRVATTREDGRAEVRPTDVPSTESQVTVLAQQGHQLTKVGSVDGLGKGELIYAVRFVGPVGYVVTFRQVDPLYTLDLRDPRAPRVVGELKIPGYSSYLHPVGDGQLIGIGQDADEAGTLLGSQVSLFDVHDPAAPDRLDMFPIRGWSDAEHDPHAFLYWPDEDLVVIPVWWEFGPQSEGTAPGAKPFIAPAGGVVVIRIDDGSLTEVGSLSHLRSGASFDDPADPTIRRSLVIGDTLWTLSPSGALASDINDLDERAWVPFA